MLYGVGSGTGAAADCLLLYRALSIGRMNVVAPVSAAVAAVVPVLVGLLMGERPTSAALLGVLPGPRRGRRGEPSPGVSDPTSTAPEPARWRPPD